MDPEEPAVSEAVPANLSERVRQATELLELVRDRRGLLAELDPAERQRLLVAAGQVARPGPWAKRELARAARRVRAEQLRAADEQSLAASGIRRKREEAVFTTPPPLVGRAPVPAGADIDRTLGAAEAAGDADAAAAALRRVREPRNCYVCKRYYHELHGFYDSLCPACGDFNYAKREQSADLRGRVALISGARVKIGYQAAIKLLRAGARVIVTTRFPRDAAQRYAREADFDDWSERLSIHGLDLRHTPSVEAFAARLLETEASLDFILNNACQTVRRPPGFYTHLLCAEREPLARLGPGERRLLEAYEAGRAPRRDTPSTLALQAPALDAPELSQLRLVAEDYAEPDSLFPAGQLDKDLQQVDLRGRNSWRLGLAEVSSIELLEVQLVNAVAPFVLNARLKPLLLRRPSRDKHIVNVSAVEGQFYRTQKTDKHPHTNMAKAALNMLTRTSAADYIRDGIHMNSVDTGWVTDEDPVEIALRKTAEHGFHPPLDIVDGAARICAPIFDGLRTGRHVWGRFLKDYAPTDW